MPLKDVTVGVLAMEDCYFYVGTEDFCLIEEMPDCSRRQYALGSRLIPVLLQYCNRRFPARNSAQRRAEQHGSPSHIFKDGPKASCETDHGSSMFDEILKIPKRENVEADSLSTPPRQRIRRSFPETRMPNSKNEEVPHSGDRE
jgi:hypothetical protein